MPQRIQASCLEVYLRRLRSAKVFFAISFTSLSFFLLWSQVSQTPPVTDSLIQEAVQNVGRDIRYTDVYRKTTFLPKDLKYILLWTRRDYAPFSNLEDGQRSFLKNNCSVYNCYITADKRFFGSDDYTKFDAVAINGRNMKVYNLPRRRSPHQKYIYFNMESSENYVVCHRKYDNYFNLTATYKLDSDIQFPYIQIRDKTGKIVGPKHNMQWITNMTRNDEIIDRIKNKTKAAAWFVSHCKTQSRREEIVKRLHKALYPYGYTIDVFGHCGHFKCTRDNQSNCDSMLERDYFFYMSFENSFSEDYVTEKLLTALNHDVVPIVFGGADYSRFLPPGSYINARNYSFNRLAATIDRLTHSSKAYSQYFKWKSHYTYHYPGSTENICNICKVLNDEKIMSSSTVKHNFRSWWNPNYTKICKN